MSQTSQCRICGGAFKQDLLVREMMFGTREKFLYHQCGECGCLQIDAFPADIARHYPPNYYSYHPLSPRNKKRARRGMRRRWIFNAPGPVAGLLRLLLRADGAFFMYRDLGMRPDWRVLDVGTGTGAHVLDLKDAGIAGAMGVDPYIKEDVHHEGELLVRKAEIRDLDGRFDLITFHHSFEHMPQQAEVLAQARALLAPGGRVLVRIPTVSSESFETYRENWVNLDAPRHFYLHSHKSLEITATKAGLKLQRLWCDSGGMQFMASEQYRQDIPLMDPRSIAMDKHTTLFTRAQRKQFERRAEALNQAMRGDALCAVLVAA